MAEFAKRARELVKEILNYEPDCLPPYNEELVRLALSEVDEHHAQAQRVLREGRQRAEAEEDAAASPRDQAQQDPDPPDAVALVVHLESIARSKRLLLSYMVQRLDRLKTIRWQHRKLPASVEPMCSQQEAEVYKAYDRILTQYMGQGQGIGHDLTLDCQPPRDNTVHVRVTRDAGAHMFSFGRLSLVEGALLRLPADEAEPFIKAGALELHDRSEFL